MIPKFPKIREKERAPIKNRNPLAFIIKLDDLKPFKTLFLIIFIKNKSKIRFSTEATIPKTPLASKNKGLNKKVNTLSG
jgi:hypothetical protein